MSNVDPVDAVAEISPGLADELRALPARNLTLFREACEALAERVVREITGPPPPGNTPKGLRFLVG